MSGLLAGKVWQSGLQADLKPITAALADIGNDDGSNIYPSIPYVCWLLGRSERSVRAWLSTLRDMKILEMVGDVTNPLKLGAGYGAEYVLRAEQLPKRSAWRAARNAHPRPRQKPMKDLQGSRKAMQSTTESPANDGTKALQTSASEWGRTFIPDPPVQPSITKSGEPSYVNPKHPHRRTPAFWCGEIFCVSEEQHFKFRQRATAAGVDPDDLEWADWYRQREEEWGQTDIEKRHPKGVMFWLSCAWGEELATLSKAS